MDAVYAAGSLAIAADDRATKAMATRLTIFGFVVIACRDRRAAMPCMPCPLPTRISSRRSTGERRAGPALPALDADLFASGSPFTACRSLVARRRRATLGPMYLVQILLPLTDNAGRRFDSTVYGRVREELSDRFGGITSFTRAPAEGMWREGGHVNRDDIVVFEVMTRDIDRSFWERYRAELERRFVQETIVVRAIRVEML
jgi:hypothetical protein